MNAFWFFDATYFSELRTWWISGLTQNFRRSRKYCPDYSYKGFVSPKRARAWVLKFVIGYNHELKHID